MKVLESEAPKPNPPKKKFNLNLPNEGKENRVDEAKEAALQKSLYPKILLQAQNGLCRTLLHGEMAETLINESEKQLPMDLLENIDTAVLNQVAKFVCCRQETRWQ